MKKQHGDTKICKHCKTEIDYYAKVCPQCRKKQGDQGLKVFAIVLGCMVLLYSVALATNSMVYQEDTEESSNEVYNEDYSENIAINESGDKQVKKVEDAKEVEKVASEEVEIEDVIEYIPYEVSELMNDLDTNALKAENKYQDQYVEITGRLSNIDSDGKYINLVPSDEEYAFIGVQCYLKDDTQKDKVMEMTKDDTVTLRGKIKSIGEVLGYSLDIDEII